MAGCYYENLHCLPYVFLGKKLSKQEDLKEMGDISSGMSSSIMQLYLKQVLEAFFHNQSSVRHFALSVIALTLNQGLIHPVQVWSISPAAAAVGYSVIRNVGQMFRIFFFFFLCETKVNFCFACNILMIPSVCVQCVPYLIAMGTDPEASMRNKADQQLVEIDKKYTGFIHVSLCAMSISYFLFAEENNLSPSRIISAPLSKLPNCFFKYLSNMNGFCDILLFNEDVYKARNTNNFFLCLSFYRWRLLRGWRCHTVCSSPSILLAGPSFEVSGKTKPTRRSALTSSVWSGGTGSIGELSSSRCSSCLMTALWVTISKLASLNVEIDCWLSRHSSSFHIISLHLFLLQKTEVNMLLFVADNFACFPYQSQEEPLFIMHHIDITLSVSGSNLLQTFKEASYSFDSG